MKARNLLAAGTFAVLASFGNAAASPVSITFSMDGQVERDEEKDVVIKERHQSIDVNYQAENFTEEAAPAFVYGFDTTWRFYLSEYPAEDRQQVQLLATGHAFGGLRVAPFTYLLLGYAPMRIQGPPGSDEALRHTVYPGLHFHLQHEKAGSLRITPVAFIDPPGRLNDSRFFLSTVQHGLSIRQTEGRHDDAYAPDRIVHQIRYDLFLDWFFFAVHYRKAGFEKTGPATRSDLSIDHTGLDLGLVFSSVQLFAGVMRSSGQLTMAGSSTTQIAGMQYRIRILSQFFEHYGLSVFAMRSEADILADAYREQEIGFVDYGTTAADLPLLDSTQLHGLPCVPVPEDRCDGLILNSTPPFRYPGDYGELTLHYQGQRWGLAVRSGILVPFRYRRASDGLPKQEDRYTDYAGLAAELQVSPDFMQGSISLTVSALYDRNAEGRRQLLGRSFSAWFKVPVLQ